MAARARIRAKDRAVARPVTTAAKVRTPAKERADARLPKIAARVRMAVQRVGKFRKNSMRHDLTLQTRRRFLALSILAGGSLLSGMAKAEESSSSALVTVRLIGTRPVELVCFLRRGN